MRSATVHSADRPSSRRLTCSVWASIPSWFCAIWHSSAAWRPKPTCRSCPRSHPSSLRPATCDGVCTSKTAAGLDQIRDAFAFVEDVALVSIEPAMAAVASSPPTGSDGRGAHLPARSFHPCSDRQGRPPDRSGGRTGDRALDASPRFCRLLRSDRLRASAPPWPTSNATRANCRTAPCTSGCCPWASRFSRFQRLVHDTARTLGNRYLSKYRGEETELDKGVVERIADPLTHLVRNAVDHGIETPADRLQAGQAAGGPPAAQRLSPGRQRHDRSLRRRPRSRHGPHPRQSPASAVSSPPPKISPTNKFTP